ncbi:hypothetical protein [Mycoavidus cysteinexigens]|nr:hypothetical protein [Mycoavidus cysteinexigens]GAM53900.1 hypothetical protein EBME_2363 [bacterium endosymbiont of Mortierella elongata FMR23-6]
MHPSSISRRQFQTPVTESKDLSSSLAGRNNTKKRKAFSSALNNINAYNDSLNKASQREVKRRSVRPFNSPKETIQSGVVPDRGLGVGIVTSDNPEKASSQLSYSDMQYQAFYQPIETFCRQPDVLNALREEDFSLDFLEQGVSYHENNQPGSQNAEMSLEGEPEANHAALSDNTFQAVGFGVRTGTSDNREEASSSLSYSDMQYQALYQPIEAFCRQSDALNTLREEGFSLDFLDEELEANHAALFVNDFQAVEENTGQQAKLKSAKRVKWTDELIEIAEEIIKADANADRKLNGKELHALLTDWCNDQEPKLAYPGYDSFRRKFLEPSQTLVQWTDELREIADEIIKANVNAVPKPNGRKLHTLLKDWCNDQEPKLVCPGYSSFLRKFLEQSRETPVKWTDELREIAEEIIKANANADRKLNGRKLHNKLKAKCDAHEPKLVCPSYISFWENFLAKP